MATTITSYDRAIGNSTGLYHTSSTQALSYINDIHSKERAVPYLDTHGKGLQRDDPRLVNIEPGKRYMIDVRISGSCYVDMQNTKKLYFCESINSHGVYYFKTWDTDRELALTWIEILEKLENGTFKEV